MSAHIQAFFDNATNTVTYLVSDPASGEAAVIDPVLDYEPHAARLTSGSADRVLAEARARGLTIRWVLETHAHADHLSAADHIRRKTGAAVAIGRQIEDVQRVFGPMFELQTTTAAFDRLLADGDVLPLGGQDIRVLHTPGHTPACVTYLIGDAAFVGDTLFMPDYGTARADFPGGDAATLYRSIAKILALPPETRLFIGHDYLPQGRDSFAWETTVADQRARNIHVHDGVGEDEFVALRRARDKTLKPPTLILPSLQVNIRAGALPEPSPSGRVFFRLPVNAL